MEPSLAHRPPSPLLVGSPLLRRWRVGKKIDCNDLHVVAYDGPPPLARPNADRLVQWSRVQRTTDAHQQASCPHRHISHLD
jgi:hypothetical protein